MTHTPTDEAYASESLKYYLVIYESWSCGWTVWHWRPESRCCETAAEAISWRDHLLKNSGKQNFPQCRNFRIFSTDTMTEVV